MKEDGYKKVIRALHETSLVYAFIGELISADNNTTKETTEENKKILSRFISSLEELRCDTDCEIPADTLDKYLEMAIKSMSILDNEK